MEDRTTIELSKSAAVVLFELLSRFSSDGKFNIMDQSEEQVLWNLHSLLESKLTEPLAANYAELLREARAQVRGE